jgi:NitT/TauT family transport system permease protein
MFSSLYAVPIVILYPVFTAWFGIGSESKIAFAGVYGFFPTMLSTAAGIQTIDRNCCSPRAAWARRCRSRSRA